MSLWEGGRGGRRERGGERGEGREGRERVRQEGGGEGGVEGGGEGGRDRKYCRTIEFKITVKVRPFQSDYLITRPPDYALI